MNDGRLLRLSSSSADLNKQRGAALLLALLTVVLVSTLASGAFWRQWQGLEVEQSERSRVQASWILAGALDWSRLILREDARTGGADHLGEPWAIVLADSKLSTFLAVDSDHTDTAPEAFLSGRIIDAQSRMNIMNLVDAGKVSVPDLLAFKRLFKLLDIDDSGLDGVAEKLRQSMEQPGAVRAAPAASASSASPASETVSSDAYPLQPRRFGQLQWIGLDAVTLQRLSDHVTLLPVRTPLNLNTASAQAISASITGLDLSDARQMVSERDRSPFENIAAARRRMPVVADSARMPVIDPARLSVSSRFFEVQRQLRLDQMIIREISLVQRNGLIVQTLWRQSDVTRIAGG